MQQFERTAAALAARPLARSMLVPRSSGPLSPGAIAGAVVGSVVGALLIALCLFPFIVRATRRRLARHGDSGLAEMGQGLGGPILAAQDLDDSSYKRCSGSGPETATVQDDPQQTTAPEQQLQSTVPQGLTVQHGLPSPTSSPTDPPSPREGQAASPLTATPPTQSPVEASSEPHRGSKGTVGRDSGRELSRSESFAPPTRELTGITSVGITEEPESFDRQTGSPEQGHLPHLKDSLRSLIHRRRSSHQRHDSRRSTQGGTDGTRSPSLITDNVLSQADPTPSGLEIDSETPGLAWDYYHDPSLGVELSGTYAQPTLVSTSADLLPTTQFPTSAPLEAGQVPAKGVGVAPSVTTRPIAEEPYTIFPDGGSTVTAGNFSGQNIFFQGIQPPGSLQRTDSLPLPIFAADPFLLLPQYNIGPSGNPMEMMRPTNSAESAWMLEHETYEIQSSVPAPVLDPVPPMLLSVDESSGAAPAVDLKPDIQFSHQPFYHLPYHSPPPAPSEAGPEVHEEPVGYYRTEVFSVTDYSTPPPSTGPSAENTPDTRLTPFTASPSPPAEAEATANSRPGASPGLSAGIPAGLSPSSGLLLSPGLSPAPSPGRSPAPSDGRSPGRSPARPPGGFVCQVCGVVKSSYHQFNHHRRYHDRPWLCQQPNCGRSFGTITHLKRHVNDKHFKTRKYYCTQPNCDYSRQGTKSFPRKDNRKRHMVNKHRIEPKDMTDEDYLGDEVMDEP